MQVRAPQFSGQALRRIRHDRGISLTEMGYLVGRSSFTIGRHETGSHRPDANVLGKRLSWPAVAATPRRR